MKINIVGVAWNPAAISLNCFKKQDLVDVNDVIQKKNGVESFEDIIRETFYKPKNKLFVNTYYFFFRWSKMLKKHTFGID